MHLNFWIFDSKYVLDGYDILVKQVQPLYPVSFQHISMFLFLFFFLFLNYFSTTNTVKIGKTQKICRFSRWYLYSGGRSAISISWSDLPFVSTTFLHTNIAAIKQKDANMEYKTCGPSCSNICKNSRPTKKFTTWKIHSPEDNVQYDSTINPARIKVNQVMTSLNLTIVYKLQQADMTSNSGNDPQHKQLLHYQCCHQSNFLSIAVHSSTKCNQAKSIKLTGENFV